MAIQEIHPKDIIEGMKVLENFTYQHANIIFRGHREVSWRLSSTLSRFKRNPFQIPSDLSTMDEMLHQFVANLQSIGALPVGDLSRRGRLEYARHYGVPSPLIDFTFSPYVALFFACSGIEDLWNQWDSITGVVVLYALDLARLAVAEASRNGTYEQKRFQWVMRQDDRTFDEMFKEGYPEDVRKFFRFPASWNTRMQRQLGCFLYDGVDYRRMQTHDLEEWIESLLEPEFKSDPEGSALTKIYFRRYWIRDVFARLELMGITGTHLLGEAGAALDVCNAYRYGRKTGPAWDLKLPDEKLDPL
jgi:hypothetical protein